MSHSVDLKRIFSDGECRIWDLKLRMDDLYVYNYSVDKYNKTESEALKQLVEFNQSIFAIVPNLKHAISKKLKQLQENNHNGNVDNHRSEVIEVLPITLEQVSQLTHLSCRGHCKTNSMPVTRHNNEAYGVPQYDLKYRLKHLDENSKQVFQPKYLFCLPEVLQRYLR